MVCLKRVITPGLLSLEAYGFVHASAPSLHWSHPYIGALIAPINIIRQGFIMILGIGKAEAAYIA